MDQSSSNWNSWFVRHLNWTLFFAWLMANGLVLWGALPAPAPTQSELSSMLSIYQDKYYTNLWNLNNMPDLVWVESTPENESPYEWQTANMVLYLKNNGNIPIQVNADASSEEILIGSTMSPKYATPGFSISSDTVILKPHGSNPINIKIEISPEILSLSSLPNNGMMYFHIYPLTTESGIGMMIILFIIAAIVILTTEVWYLRQKRRSLFNLFWNLLNWIGFIIVLSLENKSISPVSDKEEEKG